MVATYELEILIILTRRRRELIVTKYALSRGESTAGLDLLVGFYAHVGERSSSAST